VVGDHASDNFNKSAQNITRSEQTHDDQRSQTMYISPKAIINSSVPESNSARGNVKAEHSKSPNPDAKPHQAIHTTKSIYELLAIQTIAQIK
jgi:hypothetical protein